MSHEDTVQAMGAYVEGLVACDGHTWEQVGRCVYCVDCNRRLFQGTVGSKHKKVRTRPWDAARDPEKTQTMRARWGKS